MAIQGISQRAISRPPKLVTRTPANTPAKRRSRNGCLSCKKLKIKCDEAKPICEYCDHTKRACIYTTDGNTTQPANTGFTTIRPTPLSSNSGINNRVRNNDVAKLERELEHFLQCTSPGIAFTSRQTMKLNSMSSQLDISSSFELELLRFFTEVGGSFFSLNKDMDIWRFWTIEAPKLVTVSELGKYSVLAISGLKMMEKFKSSSMDELLFVDYSLKETNDESLPLTTTRTVNLNEKTAFFFKKTHELTKALSPENPPFVMDYPTAGSLLVSNVVMFTYLSLHPTASTLDPQEAGKISVLDFSSDIYGVIHSILPFLINTPFECLTFPKERHVMLTTEITVKFPFIEHLNNYLSSKLDPLVDFDTFLAFQSAVAGMELGCFGAYYFQYQLPVFRGLIPMSRNHEFKRLYKAKNYIAMKVMFYHSCLCSFLDYKMFKDNIWDNYIESFRLMAYRLFDGKFEDEVDENIYDQVVHLRLNPAKRCNNTLELLSFGTRTFDQVKEI